MDSTEQNLRQQVIALDDYDDAADALRALKRLNPAAAEPLCRDILTEAKGDAYFQAFAFETLYATNLQAGIALIENPPAKLSTATLKAMIECVTEDSGITGEAPCILDTVAPLWALIQRLSPNEAEHIGETIAWFRQTYPDDNP
ncbi:hypothetical protein [Pseudomonas sp.]|uniref:hypothetical protein n=1 Tax=Pseudomonas sp. TaxID=306 RepID=UPI003D0CD887